MRLIQHGVYNGVILQKIVKENGVVLWWQTRPENWSGDTRDVEQFKLFEEAFDSIRTYEVVEQVEDKKGRRVDIAVALNPNRVPLGYTWKYDDEDTYLVELRVSRIATLIAIRGRNLRRVLAENVKVWEGTSEIAKVFDEDTGGSYLGFQVRVAGFEEFNENIHHSLFSARKEAGWVDRSKKPEPKKPEPKKSKKSKK